MRRGRRHCRTWQGNEVRCPAGGLEHAECEWRGTPAGGEERSLLQPAGAPDHGDLGGRPQPHGNGARRRRQRVPHAAIYERDAGRQIDLNWIGGITAMPNIRVLVVDDSAPMRLAISSLLSEEPDLQVVGMAPNGRVGVDKIAQVHPDVVLLDVEMPVMDGMTALKLMRKDYP